MFISLSLKQGVLMSTIRAKTLGQDDKKGNVSSVSSYRVPIRRPLG